MGVLIFIVLLAISAFLVNMSPIKGHQINRKDSLCCNATYKVYSANQGSFTRKYTICDECGEECRTRRPKTKPAPQKPRQ